MLYNILLISILLQYSIYCAHACKPLQQETSGFGDAIDDSRSWSATCADIALPSSCTSRDYHVFCRTDQCYAVNFYWRGLMHRNGSPSSACSRRGQCLFRFRRSRSFWRTSFVFHSRHSSVPSFGHSWRCLLISLSALSSTWTVPTPCMSFCVSMWQTTLTSLAARNTAQVSRPAFQLRSTVIPPRARSPVTLPSSSHSFGKHGKRSRKPGSWLWSSISAMPAPRPKLLSIWNGGWLSKRFDRRDLHIIALITSYAFDGSLRRV